MNCVEALDSIDDDEPRSAAMQMAIDEALLYNATRATLRLYRWRAPSISFGYFTRFEDVRELFADRELVRRWTGGGIVLHDDDLTYSLIIPAAHPLYARSSHEIYSLLHRAVVAALARGGLHATLAASATPRISDACFANPVRADVLLDGRKIAGAAQRRSRAGLLQQGSIQLQRFPQNFAREFCSAVCPTAQATKIATHVIAAAGEIAESKYATQAWLTRR